MERDDNDKEELEGSNDSKDNKMMEMGMGLEAATVELEAAVDVDG